MDANGRGSSRGVALLADVVCDEGMQSIGSFVHPIVVVGAGVTNRCPLSSGAISPDRV